MKGTPASLWLSAANRVAGFWMGRTANALRQGQRAALVEMTKAATGATPKRKRAVKRRRTKR